MENYIEKILPYNFRNLDNDLITFDKGINLFTGSNASGKTSILELIYYSLHNKSFKTKNLNNIIKYNNKDLVIKSIINNKNIEINKNKQKSKIIVDKKTISNISLSQILPTQIISPDKGFIVNGNNNIKRMAINWGVFHVEQNFKNLYKNYQKIQKNINYLINKKQKNDLLVWLEQLAENIFIINEIREKYIKELKQINIAKYFDKTKLNLDNFEYKFNNGLPKNINNNKQDIYNFFTKNIDLIIKNKYLKYGSHLATIDFYFNNQKEQNLSRGEQKTLSLVFWFKQILHLIQNNKKPIVLIDDIASELDDEKISLIIGFLIQNKIQSFITNIKPLDIDANIYYVKSGKIEYN